MLGFEPMLGCFKYGHFLGSFKQLGLFTPYGFSAETLHTKIKFIILL